MEILINQDFCCRGFTFIKKRRFVNVKRKA
jgi:hypothetical protein